MSKIKLALRKLTAEQLIQFIRQIIKNLLGNTNFPTTTPTSATMTTATNDFETAVNNEKAAYEAAKALTVIALQKRTALELLANQLGNNIENLSGGDEAKIKSSGMDTRAKAVRTKAVLGKPAGLAATVGDKDGEIDLHWDAVVGAKSYRVESCLNPLTSNKWIQCITSTKSKTVILGLTSGLGYWFRVCAIDTNGESGWSDPAFKTAP
jgi:hypothetical protein